MGKIIDFEAEKLNRQIESNNDDVLLYATKKYVETKDENDLAFLNICLAKKRIVYELTKRQCDDESFRSILQMGFILVESDYPLEPDVKYYMAKYMVEEIMQYEILSIEAKMHAKFKNKERFLRAGFNKIILDIIELYDYNLRDYVVVRQELLDQFKIIMESIFNNWDNYEASKNNWSIDDIESLVHEFSLYNSEFSDSEDTLMYYLRKEFKADNESYFDASNMFDDKNIYNNNSKEVYEYELRHLNLAKQKKLYELKRVVKNFLISDDKTISYEELSKKEKVKK